MAEIRLNAKDVSANWNKIKDQYASKKEVVGKSYKYVGLDCEMVGVGPGGYDSALARVSAVNEHDQVLMDAFVRPKEPVTDYRQEITGITGKLIADRGEDFESVQQRVSELIRGKILVGHGLKHDLHVLFLSHPKRRIRDTSKYKPFRQLKKGGGIPSLKLLSQHLLGIEIHGATHDSVEDARVALKIYLRHRKVWEKELRQGRQKGESSMTVEKKKRK